MIVFIVRVHEEPGRLVGVVEQPRPGDETGTRTAFVGSEELVSFMETSLREATRGRGEPVGGA